MNYQLCKNFEQGKHLKKKFKLIYTQTNTNHSNQREKLAVSWISNLSYKAHEAHFITRGML